jgi:hypothetical protein
MNPVDAYKSVKSTVFRSLKNSSFDALVGNEFQYTCPCGLR